MADRFTYGTGISAQPINIAGAGQQLMQAAVEQKLADIEQKRAFADESQKAMLEAMSMKTIQGLDRKLQDKYAQEFDTHRNDIIQMMSKSGGVLSRPQQMEIRNRQQDIINKTMADSQAMKARDEVRQFMLDPNTQYGYNVENIAKELSKWDKAFERGEYLGDPKTILFKHQLEAPIGGYISKRYQDRVKSLNVESLADFKGNIFTTTEMRGLDAKQQDSIRKARDLVNEIMNDPNVRSRYTAADGSFVDEEKRAEIQQQIEDSISQRITESKPYRQTTGSGSTRELRELSPKTVELASGEYTDYVDYPASQAEKRFTINRALNEETGREDVFDAAQSMRVIGFSPKEDKVFFVSKGGEKKVDGAVVFGVGNKELTQTDIEGGSPKVFAELAKKSKFGDSAKATRVTDVSVKDNGDGTYTVTGNIERWRKKSLRAGVGMEDKSAVSEDELNTDKHILAESEEVSMTIKPIQDEKATTRYSAPLSEYEEVVSELYQYGIGGQSVRDFYKSQRGTKKDTKKKDSLGIL